MMNVDKYNKGHNDSIDGLRAIAILPVVIGHARPDLLSGGYLGVDIFFVISGFLITKLIIESAKNRTFTLSDFYKRRILRLFPALVMVLFVTTLFAALLLSPYQLREYGQALFATSIFSSNILFWLKSGYFDANSELNPLLHTWSLAVEEQFYLLSPFFAWIVLRGKFAFAAFLIIVSLISLLYAAATSQVVPSTYFFFTPNRVWELTLGSLTALTYLHYHEKSVPVISAVYASAVGVVSLSTIAVCMYSFNAHSNHPGILTLLPTISTAALLLFSGERTLANKFLALSPFVFIGLISYSLYLWHQPVLVFFRHYRIDELRDIDVISAVLISISLAYLTHRFIESPFRRYSRYSLRKVAFYFVSITAINLAIGLYLFLSDGLVKHKSAHLQGVKYESDFSKSVTIPSNVPPNIMIWGDSHAGMLEPVFRKQLQDRTEIILEKLGGCPPIPGFDNDWRNSGGQKCSEFNELSRAKALALPKGSIVIFAARWSNYLLPPYQADEFGRVSSQLSRSIFPSHHNQWTSFDVLGEVYTQLDLLFSELNKAGVHVAILTPIPVQAYHAEHILYRLNGDINKINARSISIDQYLFKNADFLEVLRRLLSSHPEISVIDSNKIFCAEASGCTYIHNGKMVYTDDNHLNNEGVGLVFKEWLRKF